MNPFEQFDKDLKRLIDEYKISEGHAACYLCNWEDTYICHTHNGGCSYGLKCHNICESERQKGEKLNERTIRNSMDDILPYRR